MERQEYGSEVPFVRSDSIKSAEKVPIEENKKIHWLWGSWLLLSLLACIFFTLQNLFMSGLSDQGSKGICFYNSGALILTIIYFLWQKINTGSSTDFLFQMNENGNGKSLRGNVLFWIIVNALILVAVFFIVLLTLRLSIKAELNIGLVIAVWPINSFTSALMDYFVYRQKLQPSNWYGMIGLCLCAVLVSIADAVGAQEQTGAIEKTDSAFREKVGGEEKIAAYIPILMSLVMPIMCTFQVAVQKYACVEIGVSSHDFVFGSYAVMATCCQIISIVVFVMQPYIFTWQLWTIGTLASASNVFGFLFLTAAFATGSPVGPIIAMVNCQSILVTIIRAVQTNTCPHWLQILGFVFGILGAFILSVPDQMYAIWYFLTRCRSKKQDDFKKIELETVYQS